MPKERRSSPLQKVLFRLLMLALTLALATSGSVPTTAPAPEQSYIVKGQSLDEVVRLVERYGGQITSRLPVIRSVGALLPASAVSALMSEPAILQITPNPTVLSSGNGKGNGLQRGSEAPFAGHNQVIGVDDVWAAGQLGEGVTVAIIDTGISNHKGLAPIGKNSRRSRFAGWADFVGRSAQPVDLNGHGTHIAGIIAGSEIGSDGNYLGIAPGVQLVSVRVLDEDGAGTYEQTIQGIQWVIDHKDVLNIRVLNLSLVAHVQSPYWADPLNQAVMQAWASGITVVAAAGNSGPDPLSVGVPGNNPYVISVGAFTDAYTPDDWGDDRIAPFSAAGPTHDGFLKPDLIAPGGHIVSTMLPGARLSVQHQANWVDSLYFSMAGTSQAAAVVSGVAALMIAQNPHLTPDEVKFRLMTTAVPWDQTGAAPQSVWQQGAGRLNAREAVLGDISGRANQGLDIQADLAGTQHFEGYFYWDETAGQFRLHGEEPASETEAESGGWGNWSGGWGNWSGGWGNWSGGWGNWSGGWGNWSGGWGNWSGTYLGNDAEGGSEALLVGPRDIKMKTVPTWTISNVEWVEEP